MSVPKLRFPEFSGEWEERKIQEFLDDGIIVGHLDGNHGELYPNSDEFATHGVPYVSANDLIDGKVDFGRSKRLPEKRASQFKKGIAKTGDVLFAHNATVGPTAILTTDLDFVILSTTVTYYRFDNSKYDSLFAFFALNSNRFVRQYTRVMSQSTRNQVPITMQRKFSLPVISLTEQKKIAAFLGVVDAKIAALRARVAGLERFKRGLMQALFNQTIRFIKPDGSPFPDWKEKRLGEVAKKTASVVTAQSLEADTGDYPVYGASGYLKDISTYASDVEHISIVKDGAGVGRLFLCPSFSSVLGTLDSIVATQENNTRFVFYWLSLINFEPFVTGSTIPHIYFKDYSKLVVQLPHPDEQAKIADALAAMDAKIAAVTKQIGQMQAFKKGLLQQMFV
jgi:type I restriction enzyme, S subunit